MINLKNLKNKFLKNILEKRLILLKAFNTLKKRKKNHK